MQVSIFNRIYAKLFHALASFFEVDVQAVSEIFDMQLRVLKSTTF
jgi:hypothetical protein